MKRAIESRQIDPRSLAIEMQIKLTSGGNTGKDLIVDCWNGRENVLGEFYAETSHDEKQAIVRAVNNHDALLGACEHALKLSQASLDDLLRAGGDRIAVEAERLNIARFKDAITPLVSKEEQP